MTVGCIIDGHNGRYVTALALEWGLDNSGWGGTLTRKDTEEIRLLTMLLPEADLLLEYVQKLEDYVTEHEAPEGYYAGPLEHDGSWGIWPVDYNQ